jgi:hypothetical protein
MEKLNTNLSQLRYFVSYLSLTKSVPGQHLGHAHSLSKQHYNFQGNIKYK